MTATYFIDGIEFTKENYVSFWAIYYKNNKLRHYSYGVVPAGFRKINIVIKKEYTIMETMEYLNEIDCEDNYNSETAIHWEYNAERGLCVKTITHLYCCIANDINIREGMI